MTGRRLPGCGPVLFAALAVTNLPLDAAEITTGTTTPVNTSTAESGSPGNVHISSSGSIVMSDGTYTRAVIIDSDNNLSNEGSITISNTNNATGVHVQSGRLASIFSKGGLSLIEDYTRPDSDSDGDLDGAYATGAARFGILADGPLTGRIDLTTASSISIEGNDSAGIRLDGALLGAFANDGTIIAVGTNALGVDLRGGASGNLLQSGTVSVQGENAIGVRVLNVINGAFTNEGTVTATGFASPVLTNYADPETVTSTDVPLANRIDAEDLLTGGPAVSIGAGIHQGFLNNGIIDEFVDSAEKADTTKDTIEDFDANRTLGAISSYGSAPAIVINPASGTGNLLLGKVVETVRDTTDDDADTDTTETLTTFNYDYGFINRGTITANGLNIGFEATAVSIAGASDGSQSVVIDGGLQNTNTISATAYEAHATALAIGPYVQVNRILNDGSIAATASTDTNHRATAIRFDEHASIGEIWNMSSITAATNATGAHGSAYAIVDHSGTLGRITNQGVISATLTTDATDFISGDRVAIDVRAATAPFIIDQYALTPVDDINGDGTVNANDYVTPAIVGDILLGAGNDSVSIRGGTVTADRVDFGAGVDTLLVNNGSVFSAYLANAEQVTVNNATLELTSGNSTNLTQLDVQGASVLRIRTNVQTANLTDPRLHVSGIARFDAGATIQAQLDGFINHAIDLRLLEAGDLILTGASDQLSIVTPVLYNRTVAIDATGISIALAPKTASDFGLRGNEAKAFGAVLEVAAQNLTAGTALSSYTDPEALAKDYPQLLPDYTDGVARMLANEVSLATGSISARLDQIHESGAGEWFEISLFSADHAETLDSVGSGGFGISLQTGLEFELLDTWLAGFELALRDAQYDVEKNADHEIDWTAYDATLYSSYRIHGLRFAVTASGGYLQGFSTRSIAFGGLDQTYDGAWHGYYVAGSSKLSYLFTAGKYFLAPAATLDYFKLNQRAYSETSDDDDAQLGLGIGAAQTRHLASTFSLALGRRTGLFATDISTAQTSERRSFRRARSGSIQQIYGGYRKVLSSTPYRSDVSFLASSGATFEIQDPDDTRNAIVFGANLTRRSDNVFVTLGYKGEIADHYRENKLHAEIRFTF